MDDRNQINNEPAVRLRFRTMWRGRRAPTLKQLLHRQERHESYTRWSGANSPKARRRFSGP